MLSSLQRITVRVARIGVVGWLCLTSSSLLAQFDDETAVEESLEEAVEGSVEDFGASPLEKVADPLGAAARRALEGFQEEDPVTESEVINEESPFSAPFVYIVSVITAILLRELLLLIVTGVSEWHDSRKFTV